MEGANQQVIGSGGDEDDYIRRVLETPIDPDIWRFFLEDDDGLGKPDSAGGSLDQPSVDAPKDGPDVDSNTTIATSSEGRTTRTQERKRKKTEVSSDISLDDVRQFSELSRREAASKLKVSESTLKRVCRKYGIHRWPPRGMDKVPSAGDILSLDSPEESLLMEPDSTINVAHDDRADHSWPSISHLEHESLLTLEDSRQQFGRRREYAAKSLGGELDSMGDSLDQPSVDAFKDGPDVSSVDSDTTVATSSEGSTTKTQERKHKKKGVSFDISYDNVLRLSALSRRDAASKLEVSESTLQRVCRKYGIHRWPPRGKYKNGGRAMRPPDLGQPSMDAVNNGRSFIGTERSNLDVALSDSIIRQERKIGNTGVKIEIPREVVLQYSDMRLDDAARKLKVCSATLKRICRDYGIRRWPPRN